MPDGIACTFYRASWDRDGVRAFPTWPQLVARCTDHRQGDKDGPALACATFNGPRGNASLETRSMVALDIEANPRTGELPVSFDNMVSLLTERRVRAVCWTTHSHTPDAPRYRILLPLSEPIPYQPDIDPYLTASAAAQLRIFGVCDPSKFGAASLFYLPRHGPEGVYKAQEITGQPADTGLLLTMATVTAQGVAQDQAAVAARRAANALPPEITAKIASYNASHPLPEQFVRYGYVREGNRWKSRFQHGIGATSVLPDGMTWTSFSESDAANGVGMRPAKPSSQCACFGDCFSLYTFYEHHGNFRAALASLPEVRNAESC